MALVYRWWAIHFTNASNQRWRATFGKLPTKAKKSLTSIFINVTMSNDSILIAGVDFPWKNISGYYMCVRSFMPFADISGDNVGTPILNQFGLIHAELPNPDVDQQQRILCLPIEHKSDYKSLYRAHLDAGVESGINELVILYEYRKGLFGGHKACFHVAAFPEGTWETFFEAVDKYAAAEFKWPKPLFLFQPSSTAPFPPATNIFRK